MQSRLGLAEAPEVDLTGGAPLEVLTGEFEEGRITFKNPELVDGVRPDETTIDLGPFDIDVLGSVRSGRLKSEEPISGRLRVELSEEEVASITATSSSAVAPVTSVKLEEGYVAVGSEADILGVRVPVMVEGSPVLRAGELRFEPRRVEALGAPVPQGLAQGLLGGASFAYPVGELLPFEGTLSDVEVHQGRLVLLGEVTLPAG